MQFRNRVKNIRKFCLNIYNNVVKVHTKAYAADSAFFFFISLVPLILLLLTLMKYTPLNENDFIRVAEEIFPNEINALMVSIIEEVYSKSISVIPLTAILAMWSSSRSILSLSKGLNWIYETEKKRNYIYTRVKAAIYTLLFVISTILSLIILVFGNILGNFIIEYIPLLVHLISFIVSVRVIIIMTVLTFVIMTAYSLLLDSKSTVRSHLPGAIFASAGWTISSVVFSIYIDTFTGFSNMYGSLATIVLLMLWLYFCMYVILIGGGINVFIDKLKRNK